VEGIWLDVNCVFDEGPAKLIYNFHSLNSSGKS